MELIEAIANYRTIALDTNVFIYGYEEHPEFFPVVRPIFARLDAEPEFHAVTSIITLVEVLVFPFRLQRSDLESAYTTMLLNAPNVHVYSVDATITRQAAQLRARQNLRTPDAIQIATAISAGAQAFITNDARLKIVTELPILIISEFK